MITNIYNSYNKISTLEIEKTVNFLFEHLDQYGDSKSSIRKALEYAAKERSGMGGYVINIEDSKGLVGSVIINKTGMDGYIPENILVYIAVHKAHRGKGIGYLLMEKALETCKGDIALHVEKDNPAKKLYEKFGFYNPYLEMRLIRNQSKA